MRLSKKLFNCQNNIFVLLASLLLKIMQIQQKVFIYSQLRIGASLAK